MGELGALFNPGMRHELEERRSKAMRREEEGNARDGDLRIDLESGVAVINVPGADSNSADHSRAAVQQDRAGAQDQAAEHDSTDGVGHRGSIFPGPIGLTSEQVEQALKQAGSSQWTEIQDSGSQD